MQPSYCHDSPDHARRTGYPQQGQLNYQFTSFGIDYFSSCRKIYTRFLDREKRMEPIYPKTRLEMALLPNFVNQLTILKIPVSFYKISVVRGF